jgi:hypothetical protein
MPKILQAAIRPCSIATDAKLGQNIVLPQIFISVYISPAIYHDFFCSTGLNTLAER